MFAKLPIKEQTEALKTVLVCIDNPVNFSCYYVCTVEPLY